MKIVIIGGGPTGLMAAQKLAEKGNEVHIFDHQKRAGSKFLVAGKGGFNLTNSIEKTELLNQFSHSVIREIVNNFDADDVRAWLQSINIPTYIGSSGKIFPMRGIKPNDVLQNWINCLLDLNVKFHFNTKMIDFTNDFVVVENANGINEISFHKCILALGGASWKKTGSDGTWFELFAKKNIPLKPFKAMNVGIEIDWSERMQKFEGRPIKNVIVAAGNKSIKGEIRITKYGLEGAPIYALTPEIEPEKKIQIDLKPSLESNQIEDKLRGPKMTNNLSKHLRLSKEAIQLIKDFTTKEAFLNREILAEKIKKIVIPMKQLRPIDEAISTRGGVSFEALNEDLSLKEYSNVYCSGEMLDWHVPTGGYLLQGCFSCGVYLAKEINK